MDETTRRKRRRSIRNLRRQSVILGIGSDDPIAVASENTVNTYTEENHEEDYGSIWLDGELCVPSTKHKTRHTSRTEHSYTIKDETDNLTTNFANKVSISGPDWSPVELPRSPSASLSPKIMTPCNLFTDMDSLEASVTMREHSTDVVKQSNKNLDTAFFDDSVGISPNDSIVQLTTMHPSPNESSLLEEMNILSQTNNRFSSPLFMHQPDMPNISCNNNTPNESFCGIPGSGSSQSVSDSNAINTSFVESTNKENYYTGLMIDQSLPYQAGQNITYKEDMCIEDFRNTHDLSGYVCQHQGVVRHVPEHVREGQDLPEQLGYVGENRAKISSSSIKYQCHKDVDQTKYVEAPLSGVMENIEQSCFSFVNMKIRDRRILKDRKTLNSVGSDEWDSDNEIFYTPKSAKTPSRLSAKSLASGAVHFIRNVATKLSKEKRNRRKTIFLFQDNSVPFVENPKQLSSSLPVESVESTLNYCPHSGKENNCPVNEMICGSFNSADVKPVSPDKTSNISINRTVSSNSNDIVGSDAIPLPKPISDSVQFTEVVNLGSHADKTRDVHVNVKTEKPFHSPCTVTNECDLSDDIKTLPSVPETAESDLFTLPQHLFNNCNTSDSNDNDHLELLKPPQSSSVRKKRRSADFSLVSEYNQTVNHTTENVSSNSTYRRSRRRSYDMCRQKNSMKSNSETAMETNTGDPDPDTTQRLSNDIEVKPKKVTRYRKKNEKNLEDLYTNKNFKMPTKKTWETIYEVPHNEMLVGRKKLNRTIVFESVPLAKQRQRLKKAAKLGWDITGRKRIKIADDYVKNTINAIALDLASID